MNISKPLRVASLALAGVFAASAVTVAATNAHADDGYRHREDLGWRCRHGNMEACRILRRDEWREHRGGGPYDYDHDRRFHYDHDRRFHYDHDRGFQRR